MINRLLSRRPLNHTYISRYMRLLIQAQTAQSKAPRELTDEEEVDSLIKKHFYKRVEDGQLSFYDLLPVRTARPGEKWWPWRQLMSVEERRRDGLIGPEDRWPSDVDEYLDQKAAHEAEMAAFRAETWRDMEAVFEGMFANDPVLSLLHDPDEESPHPDDDFDPDDPDPSPPNPDYEDPDDDEHLPDLTVIPNPPPSPSVIPASEPESIPSSSVIPDPDRESIPGGGAAHAEALEARAGGGPRPTNPSPYNEDSPLEIPVVPAEAGTHPPTPTDPFPSPNPKPRIARGRPPP